VDAQRRGLEGVVIGESRVSHVGGTEGRLTYRGFAIAEVVGHLGFEGTAYLLSQGSLPSPEERAAWERELTARRSLSIDVKRVIDALPGSTTPMDALRTGISALAGTSANTAYPPTLEHGWNLIAKAPTILARFHRWRTGLEPVEPDARLPHVANYLTMVQGSAPAPTATAALESYFDIVADHGMNASTFSLRLVLSTNSDYLSAAVAAIGTLKGPLHGGAPQHVLDMLDAVGEPAKAESWVRSAVQRKERLMGFGHRAYKVEDPRAILLRRIAERVATPERFALADAVERAALAELHRTKPELNTNVEFYAALVLEASGLPRDLFPPTFALARTAGWIAHAQEQTAANRLMRPDVEYVGEAPRPVPAGYPERAIA
jgi:citrate synthase